MSKKLIPVSLLPQKYQQIFSFEYFNELQSNIFNLLLNSKKSVIVATPTGSGKTVMAELAIIQSIEDVESIKNIKIAYLSPLKALTYEKEREFNKFNELGLKVETLTGDSIHNNITERIFSKITYANLLLTTIEKFDSLTRNKKNTSLVRKLNLLIIDEIHLLGDESRGPTLEAILTRIKLTNPDLRIIGLSATLPNVGAIAEWLNAETVFFGDKYRPSELKKKMVTYNPTGNDFRDKYIRINRTWRIINKFNDCQSLVFVNSRADTVLTAKKLLDYMKKKNKLVEINNDITCSNQKLQELIPYGVAFHHAGLTYDDKQVVEWLFKEKRISTLVATSTLAWGINLPAKVVIIQDLEVRNEDFETELLSTTDLHQMLGRAGRPGFDSVGYGYIIAEQGEIETKIKANLFNQQGIYSTLQEKLVDILVGEIYRKKHSLEELEDFFSKTLYYKQNDNPIDRDNFFKGVETSLQHLEKWNVIVKYEKQYRITPIGALIGQYYIDIESGIELAQYCSIRIKKGFPLVYDIIKRINAFKNFPVRSNEKKIIKTNEIEKITSKEKNFSLQKVLAILFYKIQDRPVPIEITADSYVIYYTFTRYWEFFKAVYKFMNGEQFFISKKTLLQEITEL